MLVLLDNDSGGLVAVTAGLRDRLRAKLHASRLDGQLAAGASPDSDLSLALRAQELVGARTRRDLALGAQRVLVTATLPVAVGPGMVPVNRKHVAACAAELGELIRRLLGPGPVGAQGVAQTKLLLADAGGPLYRLSMETTAGDLRAIITGAADAIGALDPAWPVTGDR
ncbi:MAG: hypothetical protein ABJB47_20965 [Actinomycetota bacterium]